jgi:hypothetical protein
MIDDLVAEISAGRFACSWLSKQNQPSSNQPSAIVAPLSPALRFLKIDDLIVETSAGKARLSKRNQPLSNQPSDIVATLSPAQNSQ